ncbi:hypothetical protein ANAEL_02339 [Anaerolineales bacterium]|nr:hypothetical protein ANAEL_02339 [Anaerolineales bacterium]
MGKTQLAQVNNFKKFAPRCKIKLVLGFLFSVLLAFMNENVMAAYSFSRHPTTEQGWQSLPPYCKVKVLQIEAEYVTWANALGPVFGHIHHYCAGLNFMNNYYKSSTKEDKRFSLESAVSEITYMINQTGDDEKMRPKFFVDRGKALLLLGRTSEGVRDMMKAIQLNPQTTEAYVALARYFSEAHMKDKALEFATDGLRYLPSSKALRRIYDENGGTQPYPDPYEKKEVPNPQANEDPVQAGAELPAMTQAPAGDSSTPASDNQTAKDQAPNNPSSDTPIGTPTNPWCRFCTDSDSKPQ